MLGEFYSAAFRKKVYATIEQLQAGVDEWLRFYNEERLHSGRYCYGKTPMQSFREAKHPANERGLNEENAKTYEDGYRNAEAQGKGGEAAPERVRLMKEIRERLKKIREAREARDRKKKQDAQSARDAGAAAAGAAAAAVRGGGIGRVYGGGIRCVSMGCAR
jgi:hypothetical protein